MSYGRVRIELAAALARITPGMLQQTIFASSGSEAVEAAIKTAIMATGRTSVLAFEGGEQPFSYPAHRKSPREPKRRQRLAPERVRGSAARVQATTAWRWGCWQRPTTRKVSARRSRAHWVGMRLSFRSAIHRCVNRAHGAHSTTRETPFENRHLPDGFGSLVRSVYLTRHGTSCV